MKGQSFLKIFGAALCALGLGGAAIHVRAEEPAPPTAPIPAEPAANLQSLYAQAGEAIQKGEHDKAVALLTQVIERDPRQAKAYLARAEIASAYGSLGWLLILDGRFEEAREPTEKAHALAPDEFTWLINLGDLALLAGDREQARTYYRQGLERITSNEQFEEGPIADLELFIQKGWAVEAARQELAWSCAKRLHPGNAGWPCNRRLQKRSSETITPLLKKRCALRWKSPKPHSAPTIPM